MGGPFLEILIGDYFFSLTTFVIRNDKYSIQIMKI